MIQKNCKFANNLKLFGKAVLPYIDTINIDYDQDHKPKCLQRSCHDNFQEICLIVEMLPLRFCSQKTSISLCFDALDIKSKYVLNKFA